ncbi:MAG: L,D-transpeptidase family protein, partial [Pseudonocardia sp.]|nr:L,D-transpeptidase family protein [Pseudonocardia sp.]
GAGLAVATTGSPRAGLGGTGPSAAPTSAAPPRPVVSITPGTQGLNPSTPLVVHVAQGTATKVTVTNKASGGAVAGKLAPDGTTWTSTAPLAYAAGYTVAVDTAGADGTKGHQDLAVSTLSPAVLAYPSFIPPPAQSTVGVGQPLVVKFNHPVHDRAAAQRALTVTASPPQPGGWYWLSATDAHYRPQTYWAAGSTITLKADVYGVDLGGGVYGETDRTETIHVHDAWVAKADGATKQMQIFLGGKLVNTMPISLGSPGFPSHVGPHVISDKQPSITMDSCTYGVCEGEPGYYKEKVDLDERISDDGEFVHSAPWSVGSQGGANVSHGCVNLSPANAKWFFDHFGIGDVVEISNSGGAQLPLFDTYGDWELSWAQWQKGSAV